jgi:hypothetical protein
MPILPICPITSGHPTRMSRDAFDTMCRHHQQIADTYCSTACRGEKLPKNIEFIDLKGDHDMTTYVTGNCQICGNKKSIKKCLDKMTCSSCDFVYRAVRNAPEMVLNLLLTTFSLAWILDALGVGNQTQERQIINEGEPGLNPISSTEELNTLRERLRVSGVDINVLSAQLKENTFEREDLQAKLDVAIERNTELFHRGEQLCHEKQALEKEVKALLANIADLSTRVQEAPPPPVSRGVDRTTHLLDLALGVIDGRIQGVDAATIAGLR